MTMADASLYRDADGVLTSARWDENLQKWIHDVVIWGPNGQPLFTASNPGRVALAQPLPPGSNKIGVVSVDNLPSTQQIRGTVSVDNLPGVQEIAGSVTVINDDTEPVPVQVTGSTVPESQALPISDVLRLSAAPVVGVKTITTTPAELFAGGARLANRIAMVVYNESSIPVYWGPAGVTTSNGFLLLPGDSITFQFRPSVATPIYFIATANAAVRVVEVA